MTDLNQTAWVSLGIIVGLVASYFLIRQIRFSLSVLRDAKPSEGKREQSSALQLRDSLLVLVKCVLEDQIELSEACIRIKVLLDNFDPALHNEEELSVFIRMYDSMAHMPTHAARKATDKRFLFKLDRQRFELEHAHREEIRAAAQYLQKRLLSTEKAIVD